MFVIQFDKNSLLGGLGDRIVGIISIKLISDLLNRDFFILWNKENIENYFTFKSYDNDNDNDNDIKYHNYIDNQKGLKNYLIETNELFPNKVNIFRLNQEISQYLYLNKNINENYLNDIFETYRKLYIDILKPTELFKTKVNDLIENKSNIVGIQVRCGDYYMKTNPDETHKTNNNVDFLKIKTICQQKFNNNYTIFFTTDNISLLKDLYSVFEKEQIVYNDDEIQHLDRKSINEDISKSFIDNYILSQHTVLLFISENSNFGRVAALSSSIDSIYSSNNCKLINKKDILSKREMLF